MQKQLSEKKLDAETTFDRFQSIDSGEFFLIFIKFVQSNTFLTLFRLDKGPFLVLLFVFY